MSQQPLSTTEKADRWSRRRAGGFIGATFCFLISQAIARPVFPDDGHAILWTWWLTAIVLMLCLASGGGLALGKKVRALMNDEVSRDNSRKGATVGFWLAMIGSLILFSAPAGRDLTGRQAAYLIVTVSLSVALLVFAYLEIRAHGHE